MDLTAFSVLAEEAEAGFTAILFPGFFAGPAAIFIIQSKSITPAKIATTFFFSTRMFFIFSMPAPCISFLTVFSSGFSSCFFSSFVSAAVSFFSGISVSSILAVTCSAVYFAPASGRINSCSSRSIVSSRLMDAVSSIIVCSKPPSSIITVLSKSSSLTASSIFVEPSLKSSP